MPRKSKVKKGGSRASNSVMSLNPKLCMDYTSPVIEGPKIDYNLEDLSLYRTTGGGRRRQSRSQRRKQSRSQRRRQSRSQRRRQTRRQSRKVGGSRASNAVMALGGRVCNSTNKLKGGCAPRHAGLSDCDYENLVSAQKSSSTSSNNTEGPGISGNSVDVACVKLSDHGLPTSVTETVPLRGGGSSDWKSTLYSRGPVNQPNMDKAQFRAFTQSGNYVPMDSLRSGKFLKGGYKKKKSKGSKKKYKKRGGGSSDWKSTLYSRGSYTAPNMDQKQFRAFTESAEYLPNESMRTASFMK